MAYKYKRTISKEQLKALEALAYWVADVHYIIERYGFEDPERERAHKTVLMWFDELDKLQTPFSIQNNVICYFENWRHYKETTTRAFLETQNVEVMEG